MVSLDAKIKRAAADLDLLYDQKDAQMRRRRVLCDGCGKRTVVSSLTYIQEHYYVAPYSCTGGDYWKPSEGAFVCPKCGKRNRLYKRPDVVTLKPYFAAVEKEHER